MDLEGTISYSQELFRGIEPMEEEDLSGLQRRDYTPEIEQLEQMLLNASGLLSQKEILVKLGYPEYDLKARNFMKNFIVAATNALLLWEDDDGLIGLVV